MRTLDLSKYKTAAGAAKAVHRFIVEGIKREMEWHEKEGLTYRGPDLKYVILRRPDDADETWARGAWHVLWEEGPYEWAVCRYSGIASEEGYGACGDKIIGDPQGGYAEPGFSFSLVFRDG